jgi:hypothetical protein
MTLLSLLSVSIGAIFCTISRGNAHHYSIISLSVLFTHILNATNATEGEVGRVDEISPRAAFGTVQLSQDIRVYSTMIHRRSTTNVKGGGALLAVLLRCLSVVVTVVVVVPVLPGSITPIVVGVVGASAALVDDSKGMPPPTDAEIAAFKAKNLLRADAALEIFVLYDPNCFPTELDGLLCLEHMDALTLYADDASHAVDGIPHPIPAPTTFSKLLPSGSSVLVGLMADNENTGGTSSRSIFAITERVASTGQTRFTERIAPGSAYYGRIGDEDYDVELVRQQLKLDQPKIVTAADGTTTTVVDGMKDEIIFGDDGKTGNRFLLGGRGENQRRPWNYGGKQIEQQQRELIRTGKYIQVCST